MSRLLEMVEEKAHQRTITVTTYKAGSGKAVVEGRLVDRRFKENFLLTGEKIPSGEIHDMIVRLLVDTKSLTIEDVEVELVRIPRPECSELYDSLSVIKGVRITKGFTQKMKSLLGGTKSCSHLRELAEAIGPAVIQGVFSIIAGNMSELRVLMNDPQMRRGFAESIVNSCHVWREDGPEFKKVFGLLNDLQKGS
ncbi:MAG: DUF2889 domain-containing protein [Desulfomonilia bacterium]